MSNDKNGPAMKSHPGFVCGDGVHLQIEVPEKPTAAWRQGYEAGIRAMAHRVCLASRSCVVRGGTVYLVADFHIETAIAAARNITRPTKKSKKTEDQ